MTVSTLRAPVPQLPEELWPGGLMGTGQPVGDPMPLGIAFALVMVPSLVYFVAVFPVPFLVLPKARPWPILHCLWILVIWVGTMIAWANGYTNALIAGIVTGGTMVAFPFASVAARPGDR